MSTSPNAVPATKSDTQPSHLLRLARKVTIQHQQMPCFPRNVTLQHQHQLQGPATKCDAPTSPIVMCLPRKRIPRSRNGSRATKLKSHYRTCVINHMKLENDPRIDPSKNCILSSRTRPFAGVILRAFETHSILVWKNITFRAAAISEIFTTCLRLPRKVPNAVPATKSDIRPSQNVTPDTKSHTSMRLPRKVTLQHLISNYSGPATKVTLQHHQLMCVPRKVTLQHHQMWFACNKKSR